MDVSLENLSEIGILIVSASGLYNCIKCTFFVNIFLKRVSLLPQVYNSWKETNFATQWCYENYIQVSYGVLLN